MICDVVTGTHGQERNLHSSERDRDAQMRGNQRSSIKCTTKMKVCFDITCV